MAAPLFFRYSIERANSNSIVPGALWSARRSRSSPLAQYLDLPRPPTVPGFDPCLQLLGEEDAVEALRRAAVADHAGLALEQVQRDAEPAHPESQELRLAAMMLLAETLDMRDTSTAQHSRTVGRYARATALALGLAPHRLERIHAAGVLHDLGKLGISDRILHKPSPLTEAEWKEMWRHPEVGAQILDHAGMPDIASWVRAHHERLDGYGYPLGLSGASISLEARILAVADAYEAMVAERPYRPAMSSAQARAELLRCSGTQFDAAVVEAFLGALEADARLESERGDAQAREANESEREHRQRQLDQVRAA